MKISYFPFLSTRAAVLVLVCISLLVDVGIYGFIVPALPEILQGEFKASESLNGFFVALYGLGVLIGAPTSSYLSDKYKKRKLPMEIGFIILAVSSLGIGYSTNIAQAFISRAGQGVASGIIWSIGLACVIDIYTSDKLDAPISIVYSGFTMGALGGPILGGVVYKYFGRKGMGYFMFGASIAILVLRFFIPDSKDLRIILALDQQLKEQETNNTQPPLNPLPEDSPNDNEINNVPSPVITTDNSTDSEKNSSAKKYKEITYLSMLKEARILLLCLIVVFTYGLTSSVEVVVPLEFDIKGLAADKIGYTFLAFSVPSMIGGLIMGKILESKRFTEKFGPYKKRFVVILTGNFLAGIFTIILGASKSIPLSVVLMGFIGFCIGSGNVPILSALGAHILDMTDPNDSGANSKVYSLFNIAYSVAALVIPSIASILYKSIGMFLTCLFLGLILTISAIVLMGYALLRTNDIILS
ncbi:hypothetical protein BB561_002250 [Smittium simulii]|uniref:Major facilitator superfamily (MFS) profile domain-containing protein n=1 Tax=Smittium simulii TaxID=133385 RepID=A0A2T9YR02_9FUNG|nr:hypothetical protein BB561_002250 [Smittium simulii]